MADIKFNGSKRVELYVRFETFRADIETQLKLLLTLTARDSLEENKYYVYLDYCHNMFERIVFSNARSCTVELIKDL